MIAFKETVLTLPYPPSANRYWRVFRGRAVLSSEAKKYRTAVADIVSDSPQATLSGRLRVGIMLCPSDRRRHDVDNRLKPLLDALESAGCFENDEQVDEIRVVRMPPVKGGYCTVVISELKRGECAA